MDYYGPARDAAVMLLVNSHNMHLSDAEDLVESADVRECGTPRFNQDEIDHQALEMELDTRQTMPYEPEITSRGELEGLGDIDYE